MIISASRRTDIPCAYAEWFMNRVREGRALVRNPMNAAQVSEVSLSPDVVDGIVFWTKDARNMLPHLEELDAWGYRYYFQFTLTPYGGALEPGLRPKEDIMASFRALSERVGRDGVVWRYDPIVLNGEIDVSWHKARFAALCEILAPLTDQVTISFVDAYAKLRTPLIRVIEPHEMEELAGFIGETAREYGLTAAACCEAGDFSALGIIRAACIDRSRLEKRCGCLLKLKPDRSQRAGCGCFESVDIGAYNTCPNGCVYCYANASAASARQYARGHDARAPILGAPLSGREKVLRRAMKRCRL